MDKDQQQRIFVIPELLLSKGTEDNTIVVIELKHPRIGTSSLYALDTSRKWLYEIVHFNDDFSSWFINESVEKDGTLYLLTPADPLFLILPYLNQDGKYCPLEDMLVDENFPDIKYLLQCCVPKKMEAITDSKAVSDKKVYRFNKKKALSWLKYKVENTSSVLCAKKMPISDGSKADNLVQKESKETEDVNETYYKYACHLVSEYLSEDFSQELFSSLGLKPLETEKRGAEKEVNIQPYKKRKAEEIMSPSYDCKEINMEVFQSKQKSKLTLAQKQLLKVDKSGMKNISSFFIKK